MTWHETGGIAAAQIGRRMTLSLRIDSSSSSSSCRISFQMAKSQRQWPLIGQLAICRFSYEMSHSHSGCHLNVAYDKKMRHGPGAVSPCHRGSATVLSGVPAADSLRGTAFAVLSVQFSSLRPEESVKRRANPAGKGRVSRDS